MPKEFIVAIAKGIYCSYRTGVIQDDRYRG